MITEETARNQLATLHKDGSALAKAFANEEEVAFEEAYQSWYSRALPLMKSLALDRYAEFQSYYAPDPRYPWSDTASYVIQDYFRGRAFVDPDFDPRPDTVRCFRNQLAILKSISDRLAWSALDTDDQVERRLRLESLETARHLMRVSERAAGALAGAVLHGFLLSLAAKHKLKFRKLTPSCLELADALKQANAFDVPVWSQCTWLAEIHDRCLRAEGEAPTKLQVRDLIDGTHWLITNVF